MTKAALIETIELIMSLAIVSNLTIDISFDESMIVPSWP